MRRKADKLDFLRISRSNVNTKSGKGNAGLRQRFKDEMQSYVIISLYLWICLSVVLLHHKSLMGADGLTLLFFGSAAIKALILAKFILIGRVIRFEEIIKYKVLWHRILWKSLATLLLLQIFTIFEELVTGLVHGSAIADTIAELMARGWLQWVSPSLVMLLVLIPLIAFEQIDISMGKGSLRRILLSRSPR